MPDKAGFKWSLSDSWTHTFSHRSTWAWSEWLPSARHSVECFTCSARGEVSQVTANWETLLSVGVTSNKTQFLDVSLILAIKWQTARIHPSSVETLPLSLKSTESEVIELLGSWAEPSNLAPEFMIEKQISDYVDSQYFHSWLLWVAHNYLQLLLLYLVKIQKCRLWWEDKKSNFRGTSPVAQWLGICLPTQRTQIRALVREDPTCRGATKPVRHSCWDCALEPGSHNYWARLPRAHAPQQEKPPQGEARAPQRRVAPAHHN